jgi:hypothetical protein
MGRCVLFDLVVLSFGPLGWVFESVWVWWCAHTQLLLAIRKSVSSFAFQTET